MKILGNSGGNHDSAAMSTPCQGKNGPVKISRRTPIKSNQEWKTLVSAVTP